jgi:hypothetical protein
MCDAHETCRKRDGRRLGDDHVRLAGRYFQSPLVPCLFVIAAGYLSKCQTMLLLAKPPGDWARLLRPLMLACDICEFAPAVRRDGIF